MPTYQYRCTACGQDLEAVQSFSDAALTECPACSGRLRKVFGSIGVVFKGAGFYKTDSRSGSPGASKERPKDATAKDKDTSSATASSGASESSSGTAGSSSGTSSGSTTTAAGSGSSGSGSSGSSGSGSASSAAA